jgi:hypothetical protein
VSTGTVRPAKESPQGYGRDVRRAGLPGRQRVTYIRPLAVDQVMNVADRMSSSMTRAASSGRSCHHAPRAPSAMSGDASNARARSVNSPSLASTSRTALCSSQRGSRSRSRAFADQDINPRTRWPRTKKGSMGEIRGDPSRRSVARIAMPGRWSARRPRLASRGASRSNSSHPMTTNLRDRDPGRYLAGVWHGSPAPCSSSQLTPYVVVSSPSVLLLV